MLEELIYADPSAIHPNPYQRRHTGFSGPEWDAFVADVHANGVQVPAPARPHPTIPGAYQLKDGHRRIAAHNQAHPADRFPLLVSDIPDIEMFETGVRLNVQRRDFTDIELAEIADEYVTKFGKSLKETAALIGYADGASVSNLRKLLKLPAPIRAQVDADAIPQAIGRQLVAIHTINPKAALKIADEVAKAPKSQKADVFDANAHREILSKLIDLEDAGWDRDWLADAPVTVERDLGDGEHELRACSGCIFNVNDQCARAACFEEKYKLFAVLEAARVATKKGIAVVAAGERIERIFKGESYQDEDKAKALLNAKKAIKQVLRIAPRPLDERSPYWTRRVFDSKHVLLVTTDKAAIDAYFAERERDAHAPTRNLSTDTASAYASEETEAEKAKRIAQEKKEMAAKRAARSAMWKSYYDAKWLLESASRQIGAELAQTVSGIFVGFIEEEFCSNHDARGAAEDIEERLEKEIENAENERAAAALRLAHVAMNVIAEETHDGAYSIANNKHEFDFENVRDQISALCDANGGHNWHDESFGVTLPDGWDHPPVHHTAFNCWLCGTFAGNMQEKLTKRDIDEDGWEDMGKDGVFCSAAHRAEYRSAELDALLSKPAKMGKPKGKGKGKKAKAKK